ncbi:MAG: Rrf2 family transcriptional regulator [Acidobacteria bacterium]|nr:Rrf2 family transcriptional regulator [Acidobacteriota bacterium]
MLSNTAEYALRAMVFLSQAMPGKVMTGRDLAAASGVPAKYLSKILLDLNRAGMVTAIRGQGGGYSLAREANDIRLIEVVEIFDRPRAHPRCLLSFEKDCSDDAGCSAHDRWKLVRSVYLDFLDSTSLADIADTAPSGGTVLNAQPSSARRSTPGRRQGR